MSHPTLQQGQSHAISQAYSALLRPCSSSSTIQGLVVPGLHNDYFHCHAPQKEGLDNDAVTVTVSKKVCLRQGGDGTSGGDRLSKEAEVCPSANSPAKEMK